MYVSFFITVGITYIPLVFHSGSFLSQFKIFSVKSLFPKLYFIDRKKKNTFVLNKKILFTRIIYYPILSIVYIIEQRAIREINNRNIYISHGIEFENNLRMYFVE